MGFFGRQKILWLFRGTRAGFPWVEHNYLPETLGFLTLDGEVGGYLTDVTAEVGSARLMSLGQAAFLFHMGIRNGLPRFTCFTLDEAR